MNKVFFGSRNYVTESPNPAPFENEYLIIQNINMGIALTEPAEYRHFKAFPFMALQTLNTNCVDFVSNEGFLLQSPGINFN